MLISCHCTQMAHVERVLQLEEAERRQREAAHAAALRRQEDAVNTPPPLAPHPYSHPRAPLLPAPFAVGERAAGAGERGQTERDGQSLPDLTRAKVAVGGVFRFRPRRAKARRA